MTTEQLAFSKAPKDTPEEPAFPNHSDTDIWVNGFVTGYGELEEKLKIQKEAYAIIYKENRDCQKRNVELEHTLYVKEVEVELLKDILYGRS